MPVINAPPTKPATAPIGPPIANPASAPAPIAARLKPVSTAASPMIFLVEEPFEQLLFSIFYSYILI